MSDKVETTRVMIQWAIRRPDLSPLSKDMVCVSETTSMAHDESSKLR
jgi:hypothetical protein